MPASDGQEGQWVRNADGTFTYRNILSGKPQTPPPGTSPPDGSNVGNPANPGYATPSGPDGLPVGAVGPGPVPGSWIDAVGAIHYKVADTTGYGQIGAAYDQRPQDILKAMDEATLREQKLVTDATNQGQANLAAAAGASYGAGQDILNRGYATAADQAAQGQVGLQQAASLADYNSALGQRAMTGLSALGDQANQASAAYGAQGDQLLQQQQAIQNTGINQLMQMQGQTNNSLADYQNFANRGAGPSAAEVQLGQGLNRSMANAVALARSGRGAGANAYAMKQAIGANAAQSQETNQSMALLRAQEEAAWRGQQLQAISGAGNLGLQGGSAAQQAWQQYLQQAGQAASGAGQLGATYANLGKDLYGAGINAQQGYSGLANSALGTGLGYNQGMTGNANQATATGLSGFDSMTTQGNQMTNAGANLGVQGAQQSGAFDQSNIVNKNNIYTSQLSSDTQRYGANQGVAINSANNSGQQQAALIGGIGSVIGGVVGGIAGGPAGAAVGAGVGGAAGRAAGSDVRMKTQIKPEPELAKRLGDIQSFMSKGKKR